MECANCGHHVAEDANVCPSCGHLLTLKSGDQHASTSAITRPRPQIPHAIQQKNNYNLLLGTGILLFVLAGVLGSIQLMRMEAARKITPPQIYIVPTIQFLPPTAQVNGNSAQAWLEYSDKANEIWAVWDKAYFLAQGATPNEISPYIETLKSIREDAMNMEYDERFKVTHTYMTDAMKYAIYAYQDWLAGGTQLNNLMALYKEHRDRWQDELDKVPH